ncbi:hypothetical protein SAMN04488074_105101 [Lentzea albidocapillata subsp. violacea]|uniref:Uncharacterized protein n=1 Tax=Lentzea albidocapillata subsp. violacea TaxID=128104 RepID=A0A1G9AT15_9PSEU|nr:hypothetical protein [Lentzea albidocapillata]SDK30014.1 hypothetical protein SAMN04488074_105101 [Lentzea albidocapillata subsp. violacea]
MSFPDTQLPLDADMYVGGDWQSIADYIRVKEAFDVERGDRSENGQAGPSRVGLQLDNSDGRFSPRNPVGPWYGTLGRNTPLRLALRLAADVFARIVANGWDTSSSGHPWTTHGSVGTVAGEFAVTPSGGTHSVPVTNRFRMTYLAGLVQGRVDVAATVSLAVSDVTGGDVEPCNLVLGGLSTTDYYIVRVVITSAEAVTVKLMHVDGTNYSDTVTIAGLTHTSSQALRVRAQLEGSVLRAKVWAASAAEPAGWHVSGTLPAARAGWVGIRSGVSASNSNALPWVFTYTDVVVSSPRYIGEVSSLPPRWDLSGNDKWVPIEAWGIMRRLGQGAPVLHSALHRALLSISPVAYWPCEDGRDSVQIASGLPDGPPMVIAGTPSLSADDGFVCSEPLPTMGTSTWDASVPTYTSTGKIQLRFLMHMPAAGVATDAIIARVYTSGSLTFWQLVYGGAGLLRLEGCRDEVTIPFSTANIGFAPQGKLLRVSVELSDSGSDVNWLISTLQVGAVGGAFTSGTAPAQSTGRATRVWMAPQRNLGDSVIGHISVQDQITTLFDLALELNAYIGETAAARIVRLCTENAVSVAIHGTRTSSMRMGPQPVGTLLELLRECEAADTGILYESCGELGVAYRTRESIYSQGARASLDYAAGEVAAPYEPVDDDQATRNDVTARRVDGATARAVQTTGRMSVLDPSAGGVGRYDSTVDVNVEADAQLPDLANWLLRLGTVDEPRYPAIAIDRASPHVVANATLSAAALDLDIGDRLTVSGTVADSHSYDVVDQIARGYTETLGAFDHKIETTGAPASPYDVLVLDDAARDRIDSGSSTLGVGVSSGALSLSIVSTQELWSTDSGDYPLDLQIGGEVITVSAMSGASSPQTATVSARSVNGVEKSHAAGAPVQLAAPNYIGL